MATPDEIERRVEQADAARSARRSAAAKRVGELAQCRAAIVEQLDDVERELGNVLAESSEDIDLEELARFTDLPVAELTRWRDNRKISRTKKKKPAARAAGTQKDTSRPATETTPTTGQVPKPRESAVGRVDTVHARERVTTGVT